MLMNDVRYCCIWAMCWKRCRACRVAASGTPTLGDAIAREDSLATFTWLGYLDAAMTPQQVSERATAAFFLWPKTLLDEDLNRSLLASTVQHDLFAGNANGWERYVKERRTDVAWFAEGLPAPSNEEEAKPESRFSRWPYPAETGAS
jgi:hypothetical protein